MNGRRASQVLFAVAGTALGAAFVAFLGAIWSGPGTDLSDKLSATGGLLLATAFMTAFGGFLAGEW